MVSHGSSRVGLVLLLMATVVAFLSGPIVGSAVDSPFAAIPFFIVGSFFLWLTLCAGGRCRGR